MSNSADRENNKPGQESGVIGTRQEYKRDVKQEQESTATATAPGKPTTPQRW